MGQMITKPDANPIVLTLAAWFVPGLGYYLMGQQKKAMYNFGIAIALAIFGVITCSFGFMLWPVLWIFAFDVYQLATKLQSGQSIGENENSIEFLNKIFKD